MKLATLLQGVCIAQTVLVGAANYLEERWTFEKGVVRTCESMPDRATLSGGLLSFFAPLLCTTPKVLVITSDVTIRSHAAIRTRDVLFQVHPGACLTFHAPSVVLSRSKMMHGDSILSGEGRVKFEVESSAWDYIKGFSTDEHGVVALPPDSLDAEYPIRFTANSVVAADPSAAETVRRKEVVLQPEFVMALEEVHARLNRNGSPTLTGSTNSISSTSSISSISSTTDGNGASPETIDGGSSSSNDDSGNGTSDSTGSTSNSGASSIGSVTSTNHAETLPEASTTTDTNTIDTTPPGEAKGDVNDRDSTHGDSTQGSENNNPPSGDPSDNRFNVWTTRTTRAPRAGSRWVHTRNAVPRAKPTAFGRVEEALEETITSSDGTAAVFFNGEDGSLRFARELKDGPRDRRGNRIGPAIRSTAILVPGDPAKIAEVMQRRKEIREELGEELMKTSSIWKSADEEREEETTAGAGGIKTTVDVKDSKKKGKIASYLGFFPNGKHGYRRRRAMDHAIAHLGEVKLTVDARGTVEGWVDGTVVLRHRAPSFFGYRSKDTTYKLQPDDDGLAVMRQGRRVWGIQAPDMWRQL